MKIGILYICTGNYAIFWKEFYESCEKYLLPNCEKYYYVFTDVEEIDYESNNSRIIRIFQQNLGWPDNTLKRFHIFLKHKELYNNIEYLFFFNANLKIVKRIFEEEFIPVDDKLMVTVHPGYYNKINTQFPYERNQLSTAYIPEGEGEYYVAGGLNGGKRDVFLSMAEEIRNNVDKDESMHYVACWHDESHINSYIYRHEAFQTLTPTYLYPEGWELPYVPSIIIRDKNRYGGHELLREGDLQTFCSKYEIIYIYGAGIKGRRMFDKLNQLGVKATFIVSDGQKKDETINVKYISEVQSPPERTGIIIAIKSELEGIFRLECKNRGYKNIYIEY